MTKCMIALLLSISFVFSFSKVGFSQQQATDDPFATPASATTDDPFAAPAGKGASQPFGDENPFTASPGKQKIKSAKEFTLDGVRLTASRVRPFTVSVSTLQIQPSKPSGGIDMGGDGMMGGGYDGGMSGGGMGMSMPGGMGMSMPGGMGMGAAGMSGPTMGMMGGMSDMQVVLAFILDEEKIAGRTRIEVLAPQGNQGNYVRLEALTGTRPSKSKADKKAPPLWSPAAAKLIKDTVSLKIWKEDAINSLKSDEGKGEQAAASEKLLKAVLSEEYDTQLERQHFELVRLEERLKRIQDEFIRRKQAKDRVIDVQLGKIILEAQGILGDQ